MVVVDVVQDAPCNSTKDATAVSEPDMTGEEEKRASFSSRESINTAPTRTWQDQMQLRYKQY
eukprot:3625949-Rhodomonas_salina.3